MTDPSEEIDLYAVFAKTIRAIKNNIILIILSFSIGCSLGIVYYQNSPNIFESRMLIISDILTESYSKSLADNLAKLIREGNFQSLSKKLDLTPEIASKLEGIEIESAIQRSSDIPEATKIYLNVNAKVKDNTIWPQLQNGIINYLQHNEFVQIRVAQRKKYYSEIIAKIDLELADLDKLKKRMGDGGLTQSSKENVVLFDPTTVNSKIIELNKERINSQNSLETVNSVQVVEGFTIFDKPASPKLSLSLVAGATFGLFMAGLVIAFKAMRSLLKFSQEKLGGA